MELDFSSLMAGFVFGTFGIYFIKRGKELGNVLKILLGVAMLVYPYFVPGIWCWVVGVVLMVVAAKA